tara:strand:- start:12008 stop:13822 length:1815 start_codon:yes stop_codon:yes gene_type:complete
MGLTLKIKYFNTFVLREEPTLATSITTEPTLDSGELAPSATVKVTDSTLSSLTSGVQYKIYGPGIDDDVTGSLDAGKLNLTLTSPQKLDKGVTLTFSAQSPYPASGVSQQFNKEWHVEESRIKGGFNEASVDFGAKAFIVDKEYDRNHRESAMIYSGIFNSRTGINNTNQFSISENITKAADTAKGSIQKLYAEDTNLIIFQENKVNGALIDKDAIYTAEGGGLSTAAKVVIGQITPYLGEYGIGKNPESFAVYGFRKYFVDKDRGAVLRLSRDGITEISSYGMKDFFRDSLRNSNDIYGMFDLYAKNYVLSLNLNSNVKQNKQTYVSSVKGRVFVGSKEKVITLTDSIPSIQPGQAVLTSSVKDKSIRVVSIVNNIVNISTNANVSAGEFIEFIPINEFGFTVNNPSTKFKTISFDDKVNGWTSFYTYKPVFGGGISGGFYTFSSGNVYKHHSGDVKNTFYGVYQPSTITVISNQNPSLVKYYKNINYEGTNNWKIISLRSPADDENYYNAYPIPGNITGRYTQEGEVKFAGFTPLEKKYYGQIKINDTSNVTGINGQKSTGIKGFFAEAILEHQPVNNNKTTNKKKHAELFSIGFNYEQSLY